MFSSLFAIRSIASDACHSIVYIHYRNEITRIRKLQYYFHSSVLSAQLSHMGIWNSFLNCCSFEETPVKNVRDRPADSKVPKVVKPVVVQKMPVSRNYPVVSQSPRKVLTKNQGPRLLVKFIVDGSV